jgi:caspase domain-containing protein
MKIRWWIYAILALCWGTLAVSSVSAGQRVALVIGNSKYRNVDRLPKTINDAMAMVALFHKASFDVVKWRVELDVMEFRRTVRDLMVTAQGADIAIVYYAGHGIEKGGTNYLIPVDAELLSDYDADDEAISLDRIILALQPARQLRLIILDACRENPFSARGSRTIVRRAVTSGLAEIEPAPDTLIAYAAKAGSLSYEGNGPNSLFTTALVKYLAEPGLDISVALGKVRDEVLKNTGNRQEPFVYGSLAGGAVSLVPAPQPKVSGPAAVAVDPNLAAQRDYERAERFPQTRPVWESFLAVHSDGFYADLARAQLSKLIAAETATEAVPNAASLDRPLDVKHADDILGLLGERSPPPSEQVAKPQPHEGPAGRADSRGQDEGRREQEQQAALVQGEGESVQACKDAEQRLTQLRMDPKQEDVARFARDLACETLRPQVLRLLESLDTFPAATLGPPTQQSGGALATRPPRSGIVRPQLQTDVEQNKVGRMKGDRRDAEPNGEDTCKRDEATLVRLRASPNRGEVISFVRNLACEQLRPQAARLLESVGN